MSLGGAERQDRWGGLAVLGRLLLGGLFLYMGLQKGLHPVEFLKQVRAYHVLTTPWMLNGVAAVLPWFEVICGFLLLLGVAVRGTALLVLLMLIPFTGMILRRALAIQEAKHLAFCAIQFDCGCGSGEVLVCRKLLENGCLILLALWLVWRRHHAWCWRARL